MIPFGSQRGNGGDLARHLSNGVDNEFVDFAEIRGSIADDLSGAFAEWEAQAHSLTRAKKYLYSLSINPDERQGRLSREQYLDYIERSEQALGLMNQPRAVVFHIKEDGVGRLREHCHVVWSRIDTQARRAIHISCDRYKLADMTRGFADDHGLKLPDGYYDKSKNWPQHSFADSAQRQKDGVSPEERRAIITEIWRSSDSAKAFVTGLGDQGYLLANGRRPYVLVDGYGGTFALPRMIDDKSVRAKDVRNFLQRDYPPESLPSVEEAQELASSQLAQSQADQPSRDLRYEDQREALLQSHDELRMKLEAELATLKQEQMAQHTALRETIRAGGNKLLAKQDAENQLVADARAERTPTGLAGLLAKVSGFSFLREKYHTFEDSRRAAQHLQERELQATLDEERRAEQEALHLLQRDEIGRRLRAQEANFVREKEALVRQEKKRQAVEAREGLEHLPAVRMSEFSQDKRPPSEFSRLAERNQPFEPEDLAFEFGRATKDPGKEKSSSTGQKIDLSFDRNGRGR